MNGLYQWAASKLIMEGEYTDAKVAYRGNIRMREEGVYPQTAGPLRKSLEGNTHHASADTPRASS